MTQENDMTTKTVTQQTIKRERTPGGDIPETVALYVSLHPELFVEYREHEADTLALCRMSSRRPTRWSTKPNLELGEPGVETDEWKQFYADMEAIAWLLWRARLVRAWTAGPDRKPTLEWAACVESAWLKDDTFRQCSDRRKQFYADREARRERLESRMLTGEEAPRTSTKKERKTERAAKKAEKARDEAISANTQEKKLHEEEGPSMQVPAQA